MPLVNADLVCLLGESISAKVGNLSVEKVEVCFAGNQPSNRFYRIVDSKTRTPICEHIHLDFTHLISYLRGKKSDQLLCPTCNQIGVKRGNEAEDPTVAKRQKVQYTPKPADLIIGWTSRTNVTYGIYDCEPENLTEEHLSFCQELTNSAHDSLEIAKSGKDNLKIVVAVDTSDSTICGFAFYYLASRFESSIFVEIENRVEDIAAGINQWMTPKRRRELFDSVYDLLLLCSESVYRKNLNAFDRYEMCRKQLFSIFLDVSDRFTEDVDAVVSKCLDDIAQWICNYNYRLDGLHMSVNRKQRQERVASCYLDLICIDPLRSGQGEPGKGQGILRHLIGALQRNVLTLARTQEQIARERSVQVVATIELYANNSNLIPMYEAIGFVSDPFGKGNRGDMYSRNLLENPIDLSASIHRKHGDPIMEWISRTNVRYAIHEFDPRELTSDEVTFCDDLRGYGHDLLEAAHRQLYNSKNLVQLMVAFSDDKYSAAIYGFGYFELTVVAQRSLIKRIQNAVQSKTVSFLSDIAKLELLTDFICELLEQFSRAAFRRVGGGAPTNSDKRESIKFLKAKFTELGINECDDNARMCIDDLADWIHTYDHRLDFGTRKSSERTVECYLKLVCVDPNRRGQGILRHLIGALQEKTLEMAKSQTRSVSVASIKLHAASDALVPMYEAVGLVRMPLHIPVANTSFLRMLCILGICYRLQLSLQNKNYSSGVNSAFARCIILS